MPRNKMFELADYLKQLRDKKSAIDFQLKELNEKIDITERDLIDQMTTEECPSFKRNGSLFCVITKEYPSAIVDKKNILYDKMKEQGYEHLFTINTNTLSATVKELKANNDDVLPEWLSGLIKITEKQNIQLRKG